MSVTDIVKIIETTTFEFRKGPEVSSHVAGGVAVTEVYAMPPAETAPADLVKVDVHFMTIGVDRAKAEASRDALLAALRTYPDLDRLAGGPSYIELGAELGDQGLALRLIALGSVVGFWDALIPESIGFTGEEADAMAGAGMVYPAPKRGFIAALRVATV